MIKQPKRFDSVFFWETARRFLDHELPKIRKKSGNTVASYRSSLNTCIDFLEEMKGICRERVCFNDLDRKRPERIILYGWLISRAGVQRPVISG